MKHPSQFRRFHRFLIVPLLVVLSACGFPLPGFARATKVPQPQWTREATQLVTRDVTREVTQIITVPVTITPAGAPNYTLTPLSASAITPIPGLPVVTIQQYSDCLYGPAAYFLYKTSLPAASSMEVVGRNPEGTWISVEEIHGWDPCWIPITQAVFMTGNMDTVPVATPTLPRSYWYKPPNPVAHRQGNEVTVTWKAVGMAQADYRGYLIVAWVCQAGARVFLLDNIAPPFAGNTGTLSTVIKDEPGCSQASSAQIYTAEKRGYSGEMIFWPPF